MTGTQLMNQASGYVALSERLRDMVGAIRGQRKQADATGLTAAAELGTHTFPLAGDLEHVTDADRLLAALAAWEALDAALAGPVTYTAADGTERTTVVAAALYAMCR